MYFEGSEKKFELMSRGSRFRERPASYWNQVVERAGAKILSSVSNERCTSYLLSESSLFVWDDRLTMITCGRTNLVRAADYLLDGLSGLDFFMYERKIEYYPHQQETDFLADIRLLSRRVPGRAYRFGPPDEHHLFLYHLDKPYRPTAGECTLEILMYNLQGPALDIFSCNQTIERVRQLTGMETVFPGFAIDDYLFQPHGYSLNAIKDSSYYTLHVTPEETGSYVSFETNVRLGERFSDTVRGVVEVFQPRSFDVVYFHPEKELAAFEMNPFTQLSYVRQSLNCGFEVGFSTYCRKLGEPQPAIELEPNP